MKPTIITVFLSGVIAGILLCSVYFPTDNAISRIIENKKQARIAKRIEAQRQEKIYDKHKIGQMIEMFRQKRRK